MAKHILVVGDDPTLLQQIDKVLTAAGYIITTQTHTTYKPEEARHVHAILVVVDRTPDDDITIWQTVQRMRLDRIMMHLPLIICTDLEPDVRETNYYERRHIIFVQKPFEDGGLLDAVNSTLSNLPIKPLAPLSIRLVALALAAL